MREKLCPMLDSPKIARLSFKVFHKMGRDEILFADVFLDVLATVSVDDCAVDEVVKVVRDYHEADLAVQDNPGMFYKSGPVPIF